MLRWRKVEITNKNKNNNKNNDTAKKNELKNAQKKKIMTSK